MPAGEPSCHQALDGIEALVLPTVRLMLDCLRGATLDSADQAFAAQLDLLGREAETLCQTMQGSLLRAMTRDCAGPENRLSAAR
jgi:hypothetical protein